ncbi:MAG: hypothetical protein LBI03_05685 [Clostridiales bacterium]|jgi:hypothetical protein|nr:hypothetical protein [Clostridiales bacterium]
MKGGLFINTMVQSTKSKNRYMPYNTAAIREAADSLMVAEAIGIDIQDNRSNKNRISILCPGHNDEHYGSCFLTEEGCHCYSGECNRTYDIFEMVKLHCNVNFREAAGLIADMCGGRERFLIEDNDKTEESNPNDPSISKMISRPDMELIGVYSTPVYAILEIIPDYYEEERESGTRHIWYPGDPDKDENDYVVIEKMVTKNPLWDLFKEDPATYDELIQNKAWEALERARETQKFYSKYSRTLARTVIPTIRRIEDIIIENGGSLRNPPDFIAEG